MLTGRQSVILFSLLAMIGGCAKHEESARPKKEEIPLDAAVSAFERLVPPSKQGNTFVNCLEIEGHDPPGAVMAALLASGREVVPASECTYVLTEPGSFHNKTKKRAMFHQLKDFVRYGNVAAEVYGSSYVHGLFGSSVLFDLEYRDKQWRVVGLQPLGVS